MFYFKGEIGKMQLFRFMSKEEFQKYQNGETLVNETIHRSNGQRTNSVGFCFMDCNEDYPEWAYEFLAGIVSNDVCAVFEADKKLLTESYGIYADPDNFLDWFATVQKREYCCTSYDKNTFRLVKYARNVKEEFKWIKCEEEQKRRKNNLKNETAESNEYLMDRIADAEDIIKHLLWDLRNKNFDPVEDIEKAEKFLKRWERINAI